MQFPLSLADFLDGIPIKEVTFRLADPASVSRTRGGDVIRHRNGARLWGGEIKLDLAPHQEAAAAEALLARLEETDASFLLYDVRKPTPISDPSGTVSGSAVKIAALAAGGRGLSLKGLPLSYAISRGDLLSFTYGSNPTRHALHRVVTGGAAGASGQTPTLEVIPAIRAGAVVDATVTLVRPVCKARLVEADYGAGGAVITPGGSLRWTQTLR